MLSILLVGFVMAVPTEPTSPGDGLVLSPTPVVRSAVHLPSRQPLGVPAGFGAVGGAATLAAAAVLMHARRRRDDEPFYVIVHGNGGSAHDFDVLLDSLGVTDDRVAAFDYTVVGRGDSSTIASRTTSTERAAEALDDLIRQLSVDHANIYSIHHSKGGAVGVTVIGNLDDGTNPPIDGYVGAALLDPAIAGGMLGRLQSAGGFSSWIPDNGGFDATRCTDGACRDVRENLGQASGVEVMVIRNPDAEITNLRDDPDGLRVFDLENDGGIAARYLAPLSPLLAFKRIWHAHSSVLEHEAVSACIKAEVAEPGSCVWDDSTKRHPVWNSGGGGGHRLAIK